MPIIVDPSTAGSITYTIDPTSEDATNTPLELVDNSTQHLTGEDLPTPAEQPIWASSADTEGAALVSNRHENRQAMLTVRLHGTSETDLDAKILAISEKVEKLRREGGTLQRTLPSGETYVLDVLSGTTQPVWGQRGYVANWRIDVTLQLTCKPYWRKAPRTLTDRVETTNPELIFTETGILGDVPALGKLVIDEDEAASQFFLMWALQSRFYDAASTAKLVYAASELTVLGTSTLTAGATGAFGGGSNVIRNTDLIANYQAILSTQATGGGAHLSHVGSFNVWARVYCPTGNTGTVKLALEWAPGDYRAPTQNSEVTFDSTWEGSWRLVNLGQVHLDKVPQGTQRWEGRIIAKSTVVGDEIDVNRVWLMPVDEGYGEARAVVRASPTPTSASARDEFEQTAGALAAKTLPVGGTWAGAGDSDDFAVETTGKTAQRSVIDDVDSNTGRFAIAGTTTLTNVLVRVDIKASAATSAALQGVFARYVDTTNHLRIGVYNNPGSGQRLIELRKRTTVGGISTSTVTTGTFEAGQFFTVQLVVTASGQYYVWVYRQGSTPVLVMSGSDPDLATGGTLATGKVGFYDFENSATADTRNYDNFAAWVPDLDAAIFASQSAEIRHDRVIREDSTGTLWTRPSDYRGDYLLIPPAGAEGRTARFIVKASRGAPDTTADTSAADDISARLTVTERFLHVPE